MRLIYARAARTHIFERMPSLSWYDQQREIYRPNRVRILLIGESVPDPKASVPRFFYAPALTGHDNLFRGVVEAIYGHRFPLGSAGTSKTTWLNRLKSDRYFLIDLVSHPVNDMKPGPRSRARKAAVPDAVSRIREINPDGIVICHAPTFKVLEEPLKEASLNVLHHLALPFPLGNKRAEFVSKFPEVARNA